MKSKRPKTTLEEMRELNDKIDALRDALFDAAIKDWLALRAKVGYFRGLR